MNRILLSRVSKLISYSRMQNVHIPGSAFVTVEHANNFVSSPARFFYTSQPLGVALPEKSTNDHTKVWVCERLVSACLMPVTPWAVMYPSKVGDSILATLIGMHVFFGLGAIQHDYVRPQFYGNFLAYFTKALVYLVTFAILGGFYYIIQHDIGIANILRRLWAIKGGPQSSPPLIDDELCSSPSAMTVLEESPRRRCCY